MSDPTARSPLLPTSRQGWQALLDRLDIRPSKGLGQNFLFERGIVERMVRALGVESDEIRRGAEGEATRTPGWLLRGHEERAGDEERHRRGGR